MNSSQPRLAAQEVLERPAESPTTNGGRAQTTAELRQLLEEKQAQRRQHFRQALDQLDDRTKRELNGEARPTMQTYADAASRYIKLLGRYHGNQRLTVDEYFCRIQHQWLGCPIVEVWDRVGPEGADLALLAKVWIHPEGICWEAREAKTVNDEGLDEERRIVFYKHLEPYTEE